MTLDLFWEQADLEDSSEHPLERELGSQLDALARFSRLIDEAQAGGNDGQIDVLLRQQSRVEEAVRRLRAALQRSQFRSAGGGPVTPDVSS